MFDVLFSFPKELSVVLIANFLQVGLQICQPFLIQELVTFLESPAGSMNVGYGLLGGFFCVSILNAASTSLTKSKRLSTANGIDCSCSFLGAFTTQADS